jgi:hypothetical protein
VPVSFQLTHLNTIPSTTDLSFVCATGSLSRFQMHQNLKVSLSTMTCEIYSISPIKVRFVSFPFADKVEHCKLYFIFTKNALLLFPDFRCSCSVRASWTDQHVQLWWCTRRCYEHCRFFDHYNSHQMPRARALRSLFSHHARALQS